MQADRGEAYRSILNNINSHPCSVLLVRLHVNTFSMNKLGRIGMKKSEREKNIACRCCKSLKCMSRAHKQNVNLRFAHSPSRRRRLYNVLCTFFRFYEFRRENFVSFCHLAAAHFFFSASTQRLIMRFFMYANVHIALYRR